LDQLGLSPGLGLGIAPVPLQDQVWRHVLLTGLEAAGLLLLETLLQQALEQVHSKFGVVALANGLHRVLLEILLFADLQRLLLLLVLALDQHRDLLHLR